MRFIGTELHFTCFWRPFYMKINRKSTKIQEKVKSAKSIKSRQSSFNFKSRFQGSKVCKMTTILQIWRHWRVLTLRSAHFCRPCRLCSAGCCSPLPHSKEAKRRRRSPGAKKLSWLRRLPFLCRKKDHWGSGSSVFSSPIKY